VGGRCRWCHGTRADSDTPKSPPHDAPISHPLPLSFSLSLLPIRSFVAASLLFSPSSQNPPRTQSQESKRSRGVTGRKPASCLREEDFLSGEEIGTGPGQNRLFWQATSSPVGAAAAAVGDERGRGDHELGRTAREEGRRRRSL
jgi:hypothetical protein